MLNTAIDKHFAFHYPAFTIGSWVGIRYKMEPSERYGRIQEIATRYPSNYAFTKSGQYGVFVVRMEDGSLREEFPEHLFPAKAPKPELVNSGLFDMMVQTMEAYHG